MLFTYTDTLLFDHWWINNFECGWKKKQFSCIDTIISDYLSVACVFPLLTGPGEPVTLWRLSVLSLLQLLCTISPVPRPTCGVQNGFQSLYKHPQSGLPHLPDDSFISSSCGWWWIEISCLWFANATQNRQEELSGRSWSWLQLRRVTKRAKILTWGRLLLL